MVSRFSRGTKKLCEPHETLRTTPPLATVVTGRLSKVSDIVRLIEADKVERGGSLMG
jgi:hypothetical protein